MDSKDSAVMVDTGVGEAGSQTNSKYDITKTWLYCSSLNIL